MDPFLGEIRLFPYTFTPRDWVACEGQLLQISEFNALYALLGTLYGGDGRTSFGVPDLRGRVAIGQGTNRVTGQIGGHEYVQLNTNQLPAHNHLLKCDNDTEDPRGLDQSPNGRYVANTQDENTKIYGVDPTGHMKNDTVENTGGNEAHENMPPFLCMRYCMATQGIFPSRT